MPPGGGAAAWRCGAQQTTPDQAGAKRFGSRCSSSCAPVLKELNLANNDLKPEFAKPLLAGLLVNQTLTSLNFRKNRIIGNGTGNNIVSGEEILCSFLSESKCFWKRLPCRSCVLPGLNILFLP